MNSKTGQPIGHYSTVNAYGAAESDDGVQLIMSMMRGAQDRVAAARGHMERGETAAKGEQLGKAIALIEGLRGALNHDVGSDIATNLDALYDYMTRRLLESNVSNDTQLLDEVAGLLAEIQDAWRQVAAQAAEITAEANAPTA